MHAKTPTRPIRDLEWERRLCLPTGGYTPAATSKILPTERLAAPNALRCLTRTGRKALYGDSGGGRQRQGGRKVRSLRNMPAGAQRIFDKRRLGYSRGPG